jgi:arylsulfatase A-like enzyme
MRSLLAISLMLTFVPLAGSAEKPNFVIVFTDDQGWTDTSVPMMSDRSDSKSDFYQTPALERMARDGMAFSNAYACAPTCTPSRAGMQFGKTPCRLKQTVVHDTLALERGIDCKDEISLAQMIHRADPSYVTGHFGKWGFHPRSPEHAGYDESDGNTNNGEGDFLSHKDKIRLPADDPKRILSTTRRANAFIEKQVAAKRPFFVQLSHYAVHAQSDALSDTIEKYKTLPRGEKCRPADYESPPPAKTSWMMTYAAMVEDLDTGLGMLLDKIEELGIQDNTYVIFTSDNGGAFRGNAPLRGQKAELWEGGLRVPTVIVGPGVKPAVQCDLPIAGWDFYATINTLAGGDSLPANYDGGSLHDVFRNGNEGTIKRGTPELIFHFPWYGGTLPMSAIRDGDFKLVMNLHNQEVQLYNLIDDLGETRDLAEARPQKTRQLKERLVSYLAEVDAETLDDMFDARIRELKRYMQKERAKKMPDVAALQRHTKALEGVQHARQSTEWR